jgi:hypothetical protein
MLLALASTPTTIRALGMTAVADPVEMTENRPLIGDDPAMYFVQANYTAGRKRLLSRLGHDGEGCSTLTRSG